MNDAATNENGNDRATDSSTYVDPDAFDALRDTASGQDGINWAEKVPEREWREHQARLRSVIDAQQEAEILGTDVLIG